jgi:hypothetical protein
MSFTKTASLTKDADTYILRGPKGALVLRAYHHLTARSHTELVVHHRVDAAVADVEHCPTTNAPCRMEYATDLYARNTLRPLVDNGDESEVWAQLERDYQTFIDPAPVVAPSHT